MNKQCEKCENEILGFCSENICSLNRLVCFECRDDHKDHAEKIISLKKYIQNNSYEHIFQDSKVNLLFSQYQYDKTLKQNDYKIQQFKMDFEYQKQKLIKNFIEQLDNKIQQKIRKLEFRQKFLIESENNYKALFDIRQTDLNTILNQYFSNKEDLNQINKKLNNFYNQDQQEFNEKVLGYKRPDNNIQQLGELFINEIINVDKHLKISLNENKDEQDGIQNNTVEDLQRLIEKKIKKNKLQTFSKKLMHFYIGNSQQQIDLVLEKELKENNNFHVLMKLEGQELNYDSKYWTEKRTTIFQPFNRHIFDGKVIVRDAFINKNIKIIKIEVVDLINNKTRYTILEKEHNRALIEDFIQKDKTLSLKYLSGIENPLELFGGDFYKEITHFKPYWRINSYDVKSDKNIRVRLGGFFSKNVNKSKQRLDLNGNSCSLEAVGLGITDSISFHQSHANKSAGIRQWSDENTLLNQNGQIYAHVNLYGK